jgi:DTW domain-containing protein YfiP
MRTPAQLLLQKKSCFIWTALTWQQAPRQAHITRALADMPVLEATAAFVARGESILLSDKTRELR